MLFGSIFGEIHSELLFLVQKVPISERNTEILRNLFFFKSLTRVNSEENLDLFQDFLDQTSKRGKILTNTVFLPKVSHIQLNYAFLLF